MRFYNKIRTGFTLVEVVVAVGIVAILAAVVLTTFQEARKSARDKQRISDIASIQLALRLYKDSNGSYPSIPTGEVVGDSAGTLDGLLAPYLSRIPGDPLRTSDATYQYFYDSRFKCKGSIDDFRAVLFATKTEKTGTPNFGVHPSPSGICMPSGIAGDSNDGSPTVSTYGIVLGPQVP